MTHYPLITVVGGSGFVGRHIVKLLASKGYRLRVLVRDCVAAEFLKTAGYPGQIFLEHADITRPATLEGKFAGSDAVVSLVSILYQTGRQRFDSINVGGAKAVAEESARAGVKTLIHISAAGVEQAQDTAYGSTKIAGERAVREAFPNATILRPSLIIGPEDGFFQRFGRMSLISPFLPMIGGGKTIFEPVLVTDIAMAVYKCINLPQARGKTYELGGPEKLSFRAMLELMRTLTNRKPWLISLPFGVASFQAFFLELLSRVTPWPPVMTRDQVKLLKHNNLIHPNALSFRDLGLVPAAIDSQLPNYLTRFVKE